MLRSLKIVLLLSIPLLLGIATCRLFEPAETRAHRRSLDEGRALWQKQGPTYFYWRNHHSVSGIVQVTGVQVVEGRPVARFYKTMRRNGRSMRIVGSGRETGATLGREKDAAPAVTMLELYDLCETSLRVRDDNLRKQLRIGKAGELEVCVTVDRRCADDCGQNYGVAGTTRGRLDDRQIQKFLKTPGTRWQ